MHYSWKNPRSRLIKEYHVLVHLINEYK